MVELSPYRGNPRRSFFFQIVWIDGVREQVDLPIDGAYQRMDLKESFPFGGLLRQLHLLIERSTFVKAYAFHLW
jgi:hypothetical protein